MSVLTSTESNQTLHERLAADLRAKIRGNELAPGARLPSRDQLAAQYGVSTITVREALRRLADEGYIFSRRGSGCYVNEIDGAHPNGSNGNGTKISLAGKRDFSVQGEREFSNVAAVLTPLTDALSGADAARYQLLERGAFNEVRRLGLHVLALHPDHLNDSEIKRLAAMRIRGVIMGDFGADARREVACAHSLAKRGVPVVMFGDSDEFQGFDRVVSDHEKGAYELTRWLIGQGRTRILNVWAMPVEGYWFAQRFAGYERAMREAGLEPLAPLHVPPTPLVGASGSMPFEQHVRFVAGFLVEHLHGSAPIDALMVGTDRDAFGISAACRLFGKEPGRDVLVAGYDNYWRECEERHFEPSVPQATVDKHTGQIGIELVSLLFQRTQNILPDVPQRRVVAPEVIVT